jgi:glucosamine-6-phosphate deaminase
MSASPAISPIPDAPRTSICATREEAGLAAATHVSNLLAGILREQRVARVVFACAPSQTEFLSALVGSLRDTVDWKRVEAFHMDEYLGLDAQHPASFRRYLHEHFLSRVEIGAFHPICGEADPRVECARYAALIEDEPLDLICLGIGENGHVAFNDPPVARFDDPERVKVVELDAMCRQQQVHDGCFPNLSSVPRHALTLTLPVFREARHLSVVVPGSRKAAAVAAACNGPVSTACPASLLQCRENVRLFLDGKSAALLNSRNP